MPSRVYKLSIIILIEGIIAMIHIFRLGQIFEGYAYNLYYSYFSDLILPFGIYFLLSTNETTIPVLRKWYVKAGAIFLLTTGAEICQLFGIEVLGVTLDPIDICIYGVGVLMAVFVDKQILTRIFRFWATPEGRVY